MQLLWRWRVWWPFSTWTTWPKRRPGSGPAGDSKSGGPEEGPRGEATAGRPRGGDGGGGRGGSPGPVQLSGDEWARVLRG